MDTEFTIIVVQEKNTKVIGKMVTSMVKAHTITPSGMYILGYGLQVKRVDKEFLNIKTVLSTKVSG